MRHKNAHNKILGIFMLINDIEKIQRINDFKEGKENSDKFENFYPRVYI